MFSTNCTTGVKYTKGGFHIHIPSSRPNVGEDRHKDIQESSKSLISALHSTSRQPLMIELFTPYHVSRIIVKVAKLAYLVSPLGLGV